MLALMIPQLEQLNACGMYLQVTTLAKISNHTCTWLLLQALSSSASCSPIVLDSISTSLIKWPVIHQPSNALWQYWTHTVCKLFTESTSGNRLQKPLGAWTSTYQQYCFWQWHLSPNDRLLHQPAPNKHPRAAILIWMQNLQLAFSPAIPMNQQFYGPPVTPSNTYHHCIGLSVPP